MGGFLFFKQKTAYEMRISDWSSDVCSSDLWIGAGAGKSAMVPLALSPREEADAGEPEKEWEDGCRLRNGDGRRRSEERRVGKEWSVRVDLGGRRIIKQKKTLYYIMFTNA